MSALDTQSEKSPFLTHHREVHSVEETPEFSMRVERVHVSTLTRQAHEGLVKGKVNGARTWRQSLDWRIQRRKE